MPAPSAKVLIAEVPEMDQRLRECLPGHELTFVRTMDQAIRILRRGWFHLVVIGMHFDESRMFELLRYVRALPAYKDVPILCVQGIDLNLSEAVLKNIDDAVRALGGKAFLDLKGGSIDFRASSWG
jgi:PleD family two-component response regulator